MPDKNIKYCFGFPKYLLELSEALAKSKLDKIDIRQMIMPYERIKDMERAYKRMLKSLDEKKKQ